MPKGLTATRPKRLKEADVVKTGLDFMKLHHFEPIRLQNGLVQGFRSQSVFRLGIKGRADWAFVRTRTKKGSLRPGLVEYCYVEFKAPGQTIRPEQEQWITQARKGGYIVIVADSFDALHQAFYEAFQEG